MNIKFLTFILCAGLLCAQAVKAEDAASVEDFGLDETIAAVEDTVAENAEEAKQQVQNTAQDLAQENPVEITETIETVEVMPENSAPEEQTEQSEPIMEQNEEENKSVDLSTYVKELNLDAKQLVQAREISNNGRLNREQLKHSIERLQEQVRNLENKNLEEFAAILTPEQREVLQKLRQAEETKNTENK